jgi:hypothetical protein
VSDLASSSPVGTGPAVSARSRRLTLIGTIAVLVPLVAAGLVAGPRLWHTVNSEATNSVAVQSFPAQQPSAATELPLERAPAPTGSQVGDLGRFSARDPFASPLAAVQPAATPTATTPAVPAITAAPASLLPATPVPVTTPSATTPSDAAAQATAVQATAAQAAAAPATATPGSVLPATSDSPMGGSPAAPAATAAPNGVAPATVAPNGVAPATAAPAGAAPATTAPVTAAPAGVAPAAPAAAPTVGAAPAATIAINGISEQIAMNGQFPAADPVFRLVALGAGSVQIGVADGGSAGGQQSVTLLQGRPLTLLDTSSGARYELRLVSLP